MPQTNTALTSRRVVLLCDGGSILNVTFRGDKADISGDGVSAILTQERAGSGIHYSGNGHDLRGKGPQLTWTNPAGSVHLCRDQAWAMQQPQIQPTIQRPSLANTTWQLIRFQSSDDAIGSQIPPNPDRYRLAFQPDGTLAMQLDCNRANGKWQVTAPSSRGGGLSLTSGAMTRAMCQAGALDSRIARDMAYVRSYTLEGDQLSLALEADAGTYIWQRLPNKP